MTKPYSASRLTRLALYTAAALALHWLEAQFPPPVPGVPIRLGLANSAALLAMAQFSPLDAGLVTVTRCIIGPLLGGSPMGILYSLAGGLCAWAAMALAWRWGYATQKLSLVGVSLTGAYMHTVGQLALGSWVAGAGVWAYYPVMGALSLATGALVGFGSMLVLRRLDSLGK